MAKKANEIKYGIEITKPHSKEMYEHNDKVAKEMKENILEAWEAEISKVEETIHNAELEATEWDEDNLKESNPKLVKLQRGVCYSGYGGGYSIADVNDEFLQELDTMANWQLHQEYGYLVSEGLVPKVKCSMLGHGDDETYYEVKFEGIGYDIEIPCSAELDQEMANESENIQ